MVLWPAIALLAVAETPTSSASLTLARALELATERHETGRIARSQIERAEAVKAMAISELLPEVALEGAYTRQPERSFDLGGGNRQIVQEENVLAARASIAVTLLEAKNFVVLERAGTTFQAVEARAGEMERLLGFEVAQIFMAVLSADPLIAASKRRIEVAAKAKADAERRFQHGLSGKNDVTRAELELATAELAATDAEASARDLRLWLERYVGPAARSELVPPVELYASPSESEDAMIAVAEGSRKDLAALRADADAARVAAGEPLWGLVPTLSFDGSYDLTTQGGFTGQNQGWALSLTARWVLYDRGRRYRQLEERDALAKEAKLMFERALEDARIEVRRALVKLDRSRIALSRAETRAALSRKNVEEVTVRYREGVATAFELADANAQEFDAATELSRARFDLALSVLAIRRATGGPVM